MRLLPMTALAATCCLTPFATPALTQPARKITLENYIENSNPLPPQALRPVEHKPTPSEIRNIRDLNAQEEMAKWAFWMLMATIGGSLLTFVGLGFVWRTLHHTRRSADYAGQGIEQNRRSINKQLRAYVGPANVAYVYNADTEAFAATAEIKNFGNTPAYKFKSCVTLQYLPYPVEKLPEVACTNSDENTLHPSSTTLAENVLPIQGDRLNQIRNRSHCFFLSIILEYEDFAGRKHQEKAGLYATGTPQSSRWDSSHSGGMIFLYGTSEEL